MVSLFRLLSWDFLGFILEEEPDLINEVGLEVQRSQPRSTGNSVWGAGSAWWSLAGWSWNREEKKTQRLKIPG